MDGDNFLAVTAEDDSTVLTINTPNSISAEMLDSLDFNKGYAEVRIDGQNFTLGKYVSDNTSYSYYFSFPPYKATAGLGGTQLLFIFFCPAGIAYRRLSGLLFLPPQCPPDH